MLLRLSKKALIHFSESSLLLAIRLMFVAMGFVLTITFTHFLGAEGFGRYAYLLSWYEICIIIGIGGLDSLLVRQISRYKEEKTQRGPETIAAGVGLQLKQLHQ